MSASRRSTPSAGTVSMEDNLPGWDADVLRRFRRKLSVWYSAHGRNLPWRCTHDPYAIWLSEIMLQQTTVVAVLPYYARFLEQFPTVSDLAAADEQEVLRAWEGLGYYSRARNLLKAARSIVADHGGVFPTEARLLETLPGIGRYTANAIASFAYDQREPIVEANTLRLYCRLIGYRADPRSCEGQRNLWNFAQSLLPRKHSGRFNQALIELGGVVCTPRTPDCQRCPVAIDCAAFRENLQEEIPQAARRPELTDLVDICAVVHREGRYLITQRGPKERWAGLWDFPRLTVAESVASRMAQVPRDDRLTAWSAELADHLRTKFGLEVELTGPVTRLRHAITRYRVQLIGFAGEVQSRRATTPATAENDPSAVNTPPASWVSVHGLESLPLTVTARKIARQLPF